MRFWVFLKDWLHKALVSSKEIPSPELFLSLEEAYYPILSQRVSSNALQENSNLEVLEENIARLSNRLQWSWCQVIQHIKHERESWNAFLALTSKIGLQESQVPEPRGKIWNKADLLLVEEDQVIHLSWIHGSLRGLMGCTHKCWGNRLMSLQRLSWLSYKGHSYWERFLKTGRQQTSLLSATRAGKRVQGTTGHSASLGGMLPTGQGKRSHIFPTHRWGCKWNAVSHSGLPAIWKIQMCWSEFSTGPQRWLWDWSICPIKRLKELQSLRLEKRRFRRMFSIYTEVWGVGMKMKEPDAFQ